MQVVKPVFDEISIVYSKVKNECLESLGKHCHLLDWIIWMNMWIFIHHGIKCVFIAVLVLLLQHVCIALNKLVRLCIKFFQQEITSNDWIF